MSETLEPSTSTSAPAGSFEEFSQMFQAMFSDCAMYTVPKNILNARSEKRIRSMSGAIRGKDDWITNMASPEIRAHWTREAKEQGLTECEIDYVFDELNHYAALHVSGSSIKLSAVENVWMSDSLIDADITQELKRYVAVLENVPEKDRDYHPNTNNQVVNLIHPSLYPLIYARSRFLSQPILSPAAAVDLNMFGQFPGSFKQWKEDIEKVWKDEQGKSIFYLPSANKRTNHMPQGSSGPFTSEKFCWLPTEFRVHDDGAVTIESYINNLHPVKHAAFYPTIARIFSKFVPMLEHVLTDVLFPRARRVKPDSHNWFWSNDSEPDYDDLDYDDRYEEWKENRLFAEPQPERFVAPERQMTPYSLRGRRLQAICKMSNIRLTPEQPEYEGGSWHVEAMANERIVATGIYYYDVENITESTLNFRESVEEYSDYKRDDHDGVNRAYGVYDDKYDDRVLLVQNIGGVQAKNGRCVVFPNVYQHQVSGFKLADPTKPGHRNILAFFFIDPTTRIPSTEIVPPQQREWWSETVMEQGALGRLPSLVKEKIGKYVDFPISLAEAKELRLELMEERSTSNSASESLFSPDFYMCEH
ncbi:hypothetical protein GGH16_000954 [Coemansia sp. RSA 560]|nr:hypothetical protein GGH16_000954 [Coemansia sp. RSA 560]KAJ2200438.1 hypothetical protein IW144_001123 [Coemansia sp. RSA 522]KAJ2257492.1 hypothetical protein GGH98_000813 [Coemansia sp. RSA 454]KAJ2552974.1 hypothetical protein IWW35_002065 [Coemansia sp. RSA 1878]